jgi:hypothetical protein
MLHSAPHRKVVSLHDELGDNRDVLSPFTTDLRGRRQRPYLHVPPGPPSGPLRRDEEVAFAGQAVSRDGHHDSCGGRTGRQGVASYRPP